MRARQIARSHSILLILIINLSLGACLPPAGGEAVSGETVVSPHDWLEIYFTDPDAPGARTYEGGPDEALAAAIDGARLSVDMAVYNFNLWSIRNALLRAHRRGVVVRVVMESDNMDAAEVRALVEAGIPVRGDQHEGLMHNKFVIVDRSEVWTGSMNFSVGGAYKDHNNLIRIRSLLMAENYLTEFEEMFSDRRFGPDRAAATPHPSLTIDGTQVETYFSPDDGVAARIVELVNGAQESVHFMAFSFTSDAIGSAMIEQAQAGIEVRGVMDSGQAASNQGSEYDMFVQAGLDVRLDGSDGLLHHKVIIIDRSIVITGSYNFTASAEERNDENLVILFSPQAAEAYWQEFRRMLLQTDPGQLEGEIGLEIGPCRPASGLMPVTFRRKF